MFCFLFFLFFGSLVYKITTKSDFVERGEVVLGISLVVINSFKK